MTTTRPAHADAVHACQTVEELAAGVRATAGLQAALERVLRREWAAGPTEAYENEVARCVIDRFVELLRPEEDRVVRALAGEPHATMIA